MKFKSNSKSWRNGCIDLRAGLSEILEQYAKVLYNAVGKYNGILKIQHLLAGNICNSFKENFEKNNFEKGLSMVKRLQQLSSGEKYVGMEREEGNEIINNNRQNCSKEKIESYDKAMKAIDEGSFYVYDGPCYSSDSSSDSDPLVRVKDSNKTKSTTFSNADKLDNKKLKSNESVIPNIAKTSEKVNKDNDSKYFIERCLFKIKIFYLNTKQRPCKFK